MAITSLVHMVLQGRIFPDDQLRFGSAGEWFPAGQVPNLFPKGAATAYAPGTARSARPKLPPAEGVMERLERIYAAEAAHAQTSAVPPARETAVSGASTAVTAGAPRAPAAPSPPAPVAASAMPGSSTGELESSRSAATDIIRGFSASVAKGSSSAPSRAPASRAPARAPARSFSGGGGEGIFGLPPAVLGGAVAAALLGLAAWYLVPLLLSGQAAKAKYRALLELKKEVEVARQSRDSNKGTDIAKKIEKIRVESHVKSDKSPLYHVRNAASYLERAARAVNAPVEDADPYDMAMKQFEIAMSKAGASLGIK